MESCHCRSQQAKARRVCAYWGAQSSPVWKSSAGYQPGLPGLVRWTSRRVGVLNRGPRHQGDEQPWRQEILTALLLDQGKLSAQEPVPQGCWLARTTPATAHKARREGDIPQYRTSDRCGACVGYRSAGS